MEVIYPAIFTGDETIQAFFTLKNASYSADDSSIAGLNLGYNTNEGSEIVTKNRKKVFQHFDIDFNRIALANQVHGNRIQMVTSGGTYANTDALVTPVPGLALAIQVADCAAVLMGDPGNKIIAAVHAGWRGAVAAILPDALKKMSAAGADIAEARAFISPCISVENFEVGQEVAEQFPDMFVDYEHYEKPHVRLKEFLQHQLLEAGIEADNIEMHPGCTVEEDRFYSYRREQEQSGRMLAIIQIK